MAKIVQCPKCKADVKIDISDAIDENGEIYICPKCGYQFRFTNK